MITEQDLTEDYPVTSWTVAEEYLEVGIEPFQSGFWEDAFGARLCWECPLPPPDNHCHASARGGTRYPTKEYTAWLQHVAPQLKELLDGREPDTTAWWKVEVELWLGSRGDGQNYLKPLLDALSGAYVVDKAFDDAQGRRIGKGTILKPGGLWDDDCRVKGSWSVIAIRHPTPYAQVTAWQTTLPVDYRAQQVEEARQQREKARQAAQEARRQAREAERDRKAQAKREDDQKRTLTRTIYEWRVFLDSLGGPDYASCRSRIRSARKGQLFEERGAEVASDMLSVTFSPGEWAKLNGGAE